MSGEEKKCTRHNGRAVTAMRWFVIWLASALVMISAGCIGKRSAEMVRVNELVNYLGQEVTVKGRTGQILEGYTTRAFTLRDDYGDVVVVLMSSDKPYPINHWC